MKTFKKYLIAHIGSCIVSTSIGILLLLVGESVGPDGPLLGVSSGYDVIFFFFTFPPFLVTPIFFVSFLLVIKSEIKPLQLGVSSGIYFSYSFILATLGGVTNLFGNQLWILALIILLGLGVIHNIIFLKWKGTETAMIG